MPGPGLAMVIPGEDRSFGGSELYVDLVPSTSWAQNARALLNASEWKKLSGQVKDRCGRCCEICATPENKARRLYIEAHERWSFDLTRNTQTLRRLIGLCSACHRATHMGFAASIGAEKGALRQLCRVNGWTMAQAQAHVSEAFNLWRSRNMIAWRVEMDVLASWRALTVETSSPCIRVCRMQSGMCVGCRRTLEEIASWPTLSEAEKSRLVKKVLPSRSVL